MALIYIVEDDRDIREIEALALENSGYTVEGFACSRDFYKKIGQRLPELIILDIMLPDEDGLEVLKKLRTDAATRYIPIIMVTAKTTELDKVRGLNLGADDYLAKPFGVMELIARVKALLRRSQVLHEEKFYHCGSIFMDDEKRAVYIDDKPCELTYKEYELLKILLQNAGIALPRDLIMDRIWGFDYQGESRTLDMHIKTLRQKLKEEGSLIKTVRNVGYVMGS